MRRDNFHIKTNLLTALFATIYIFAFAFAGYTQTEKNKFASTLYLEAKVHYGFIIPHHTELWALTNGYFPTWELSIVKQTDGRKPYQYYRNYPQLRLSYLHSDFGGSESLGVMNALLPNIHLPLISKKNFKFSFGIGLGIAHLSKKFDRIVNYQNLSIGSNYNAAVKFELSMQFTLKPQLQINTGLSMLHLSNGTIKTPNYGLNIPAAFVGLDWKLSSKKIIYQKPSDLPQNRGKINFRIKGSVASKQIINVWDQDFRIAMGSMVLTGFYNNINKIRIGVDGIYDESEKYLLEKEDKATDDWTDITKIGVNAGHEWTFSKISMYVNLGFYVYNNNDDDTVLYNQLGINYNFLKFVFAEINLQTHWAKAEFLSFGLGFNI